MTTIDQALRYWEKERHGRERYRGYDKRYDFYDHLSIEVVRQILLAKAIQGRALCEQWLEKKVA